MLLPVILLAISGKRSIIVDIERFMIDAVIKTLLKVLFVRTFDLASFRPAIKLVLPLSGEFWKVQIPHCQINRRR